MFVILLLYVLNLNNVNKFKLSQKLPIPVKKLLL